MASFEVSFVLEILKLKHIAEQVKEICKEICSIPSGKYHLTIPLIPTFDCMPLFVLSDIFTTASTLVHV